MADNPTVNGIPVAGDDVGGAIHQRVKIEYGPNDTTNEVTDALPLPAKLPPSQQIFNGTAVWSNSISANVEVLKDLDISGINPGRLLVVIVRNPSTISDVLCQVKWEWVDSVGSTTRWAALSTPTGPSYFTVLKQGSTGADADGQAYLVDGGLLAAGGKLSLKNVTALGGSDGFTASVQVHALCAV